MLALCALSLALPTLGRDDGPRLLAASVSAARQLATGAGRAAPATLPAGLREAASAAVGGSDASFHVRRAGGELVARGGGLTARFGRAGVDIATAGGRISLTPVGLGPPVTPGATGNRVSYRRGGVTEWYLNGPAGLEQGFTLARPESLSLRVSGTLVPHQRRQAIEFTRGAHGAVVLRYSGLTAFDAGGRSLPARLELTGRTLSLRVDDRGARYPLTIDPLIQQGSKLAASNANGSSRFGFSVAVSSDGNTALVGGPRDNANVGAAWVFTRTGSTWTQRQTFIPTDEVATPAFFGWSVALSADGHTALIGGPSDNAGQGAAWVSTFDTGTSTWSALTKLTPSTEVGASEFGFSVALSPDASLALIGGPQDRITLTANFAFGAAWIYSKSGGTWFELQKITGSGEVGAGQFGASVSLAADNFTALIGGPHDNSDAGAVWVYQNSDGWLFDAKLTPSDESGAGLFGNSVALVGNGTSVPLTALIGAPDDNGKAGAAWVFTRSAAWSQVGSKLTPNDETGAGQFGSSVALSADATSALVGGPADGGAGAGWSFKFASPATWSQDGAKLTGSGETGAGLFGWGAALSADGSTGILGAPGDNSDTGAAWAFVSAAQSYTVTTTADTVNDFNCQPASCTLRQAVNAANRGGGADTITVPAGTYQLSGSFGALVVSKGMTVTGAGARSTSILAAASERVFDLTASANPVVIQGFTISGGTATPNNGFFGGNVRSSGVLTLVEDTITNGNAFSGGGVSNNAGTLVIDRSTVSGNTAPNGGGDSGGVQNFGDNAGHPGVLTIRNSTVSDNTARGGGGVFSWGDNANTTTLENSTIAFNSSMATGSGPDRGTGGIGGGGTFTFKNTIVSNNTSSGTPSNCVVPAPGTIMSLGNNLEGGTDCGFTAAGEIQNANPLLGPLANNGGPTDTRAITASSAAFDAGSADCPPPTIDQRGTTRPQGAKCDIGAFELFVAPPPAAPGAPAAPAATTPTIVGQAAPTIGAQSATVSASVNPNGSATTVVVQYGTTAAYGQQTAAVAIGAGTTPQIVNQTLSGLTPSTVYHLRFVAMNAGGQTAGPDATFTTAVPGGAAAQPPPGPVQGVSVDVFPFKGTVLVNGQPLQVGQQIPLGSIIDARKGTVVLQSVVNGVVQSMQFAGGIFQVLQLPDGTIQLVLQGGDFSICKTPAKTKKKATQRHTSAALNAKSVRGLWGNGKGSFQTKGRYAAATVRGTIYHVVDRCDGTFTHVVEGTVSVQDFVLNKTVSVPAGGSYLAKAKP